MADKHAAESSSTSNISPESSSTSNISPESSESLVELNIKTLDSQIYNFRVDKNITVSEFKEKVTSKIGVPVQQLRLIFRGKVLKDNHHLSEYHVENGDTLHLVLRQVSDVQSSSGSSSGETNANNNNSGQDANAAGTRPRVAQHSVVLGTFGYGDQGEAGVPDISRVIGAVLNSIGIGGQTAMGAAGGVMPSTQFNPVPAPQGSQTEGSQANPGSQGQAGNQSQFRQAFPGQSMPQAVQFPLGTAIAVPSLNVPIPDSLNTLSVFMNRMETALSQDGGQPSNNAAGSPPVGSPPVELPSNMRGLPTPAALAIILRQAERLFSGPAISSIARIAERLEQEEGSTDVTARSQIQTESMQAGLAMQHLGALLLELGRTTLTLRIGQSSAESSVHAGPAVYISPSGPNPIMVQPFPLQASSLFGSAGGAPPLNPAAFGPGGVGAVPRHVNIHIHAVGSRTTNGEGNQEGFDGTGDPGQARAMPRNVTATATPLRPGAVQPTVVSQRDSASMVAEINSQIRNMVNNMQNGNQATAGQPGSSAGPNQSTTSIVGDGVGVTSSPAPVIDGQTDIEGAMNVKDTTSSGTAASAESSSGGITIQKSADDAECAPTTSSGAGDSESGKAVPLGLGLGGLQPKRRNRLTRIQSRSSDNVLADDQNPPSSSAGRKALQSLVSLSKKRNSSTSTSGIGEVMETGGSSGGQLDPASVMSQVMQSPALEGLLSGVSQQTGIGSPDVFRNMLGQLTQNPEMMNTVNQLAQQIDTQDLGSMFSGLGAGQSGGLDLSRMVQQMMPIVSQALGGGMNVPQLPSSARELQPSYSQRRPSSGEKPNDQYSQNCLQEAVQGIENQEPSREIFGSVVDSAAGLLDSGSQTSSLARDLSSDEELANEFMEMLRRDVSKRLQDETGGSGKKL